MRNGRTFEEFETYCQDNGITSHVELDTVIGRPGGKVIMTIHFTAFNFMFGLLMENRTAAECAAKITGLKQALQKAGFSLQRFFRFCLRITAANSAVFRQWKKIPTGLCQSCFL